MGAIMEAFLTLPPALILFLAFLLPLLEASVMVGMFIPGETAVIIAGVAAHEGRLPMWAVIVAAIAGAIIGDQIGFRVGRKMGPSLIRRLPARVRDSGQLDSAFRFVERRGLVAVILGRWTAMLRALVPGICGMSGMQQSTFTIGNTIGGVIWAVVCSWLGYLAGSGYRELQHRLDTGGQIAVGVVFIAVAAGVAWHHLRPGRRSRPPS